MARRSDRLLERGEAIRALAPGHICGICREMIKFAAQLDGCSHTLRAVSPQVEPEETGQDVPHLPAGLDNHDIQAVEPSSHGYQRAR